MILEVIVIVGLSISFTAAFIVVYFFRYFQRLYQEPEAFKKSYTFLTVFLAALVFHGLYQIASFYNITLRYILEVISILIFLAIIYHITRLALWVEISAEVHKEGKVRQLFELRTLQEQLKGTAKELTDTKNFFNSIIESSADAIVASDTNKKIIYFSKGAEDLFGYKSGEVLGKNVLNLYPKEALRKKDRTKRAKVLRKKGSIRNMTMKIRTSKGESKTISLSLSLLKDASGKIRGTVGVARDVTQEVSAANEVRYLKELSDKIFEGIPEGLVLLDLNFRISVINKGFERITEINKGSIIGKNAIEYLKIPELERLFEGMKLKQKFVQVAYSGQTLEPTEFAYITGKEKRKVLTDYWTPLFGKKGNVEHVLIILRDMTKRKALEENLKEQAANLKRSNELKDLFSDIMRHDLLNPVGVIKNYVELISDEGLDPMVKQSIDAISRNAQKSMEMIETAARFAKIEGEEEIMFEERDIAGILKDVIEGVKSLAEKKNITLVLKTKKSYPARVNPFIEDVFSNLITNAIKYSPEKTKVIIGLEDEGKKWRVYVKDNGEGVPDKFKEAIFTRFERLKREGVKGTGLGLAIVKRIVEMHKGKVWVDDNPEGGSIFYVEVPKDLK